MSTLTHPSTLEPPAVVLPPRHPGQRRVSKRRARFTVLACGRRWGKTRLGAALSVETALQGGRAWWVAPSYGMAAVGWRLLKQLAGQIPYSKVRETDRRISFATGGSVQVKSADDPNSLRGEGLDFVVLDECAFMHPDAWYQALRPALSDRNGRALFISTPNGRNWFWELFQRALDPAEPDWGAWQLPTADNPAIPPGEIEAARQTLPEAVFRQEYLAEFLTDGAGVFENVRACATATPRATPQPGQRYVFGVDWGKQHDFTAVAVFDATSNALVHLARWRQVDYAVQTDRLRALCEVWRPQLLLVERNSIGEPLLEQLQRDGLPALGFTTTSSSKARLIESLALALARADLTLIPDPVLLAELNAYTLRRAPSGWMQYGAPAAMHDDTVIAFALALHAASLPAQAAAFAVPYL